MHDNAFHPNIDSLIFDHSRSGYVGTKLADRLLGYGNIESVRQAHCRVGVNYKQLALKALFEFLYHHGGNHGLAGAAFACYCN